ncbi:hypothetical protein Q31a_11800 [Aureliella helgolandensis]|uniref:Uncharacterized protein n=1 Tax=Aureliella helgolandensis TaxID=2527968 RepID=A0A518G2Q2_9BACT|nr:hypothetical protein Q31a_11800 [Aureliella helgolandensis]
MEGWILERPMAETRSRMGRRWSVNRSARRGLCRAIGCVVIVGKQLDLRVVAGLEMALGKPSHESPILGKEVLARGVADGFVAHYGIGVDYVMRQKIPVSVDIFGCETCEQKGGVVVHMESRRPRGSSEQESKVSHLLRPQTRPAKGTGGPKQESSPGSGIQGACGSSEYNNVSIRPEILYFPFASLSTSCRSSVSMYNTRFS